MVTLEFLTVYIVEMDELRMVDFNATQLSLKLKVNILDEIFQDYNCDGNQKPSSASSNALATYLGW
jgi:hypothetical protein